MDRVRELVELRPDLARSVSGFLDLLEQVASHIPGRDASPPAESFNTSRLIPVVGSTAAGSARFWEEIDPTGADTDDINRRMQELLAHHDARVVRVGDVTASGVEASEVVSLVQFSNPDALGFVEFLDCPRLKTRHPRALAWRIDGESMSPRYEDGDVVIVSPDQPAADGYPCVAHQTGQIGVNCKIYSRSGDDVLLIPVNEAARPQRMKADEIVWAYRVLFSVRLNRRHAP